MIIVVNNPPPAAFAWITNNYTPTAFCILVNNTFEDHNIKQNFILQRKMKMNEYKLLDCTFSYWDFGLQSAKYEY